MINMVDIVAFGLGGAMGRLMGRLETSQRRLRAEGLVKLSSPSVRDLFFRGNGVFWLSTAFKAAFRQRHASLVIQPCCRSKYLEKLSKSAFWRLGLTFQPNIEYKLILGDLSKLALSLNICYITNHD